MLQQFIDIVERMRELHDKIMQARQTGVWTLLDKIAEDMEIPKTPQETHFLREKWSHIRWMASKLAAKTFGDKLQQDIKQDTTITVSWGKPKVKWLMLKKLWMKYKRQLFKAYKIHN